MTDLLKDLPKDKMTLDAERAALKSRDLVTLVLGHMREAFLYARRCCREQLPFDELFSLSYKALEHAARNYKTRPGGPRFFGYAKVYIRGEICREWKRKDVVKNSSGHEETVCMDDGEDAHEADYVGYRPAMKIGFFNASLPDYEGIAIRDLIHTLEPIIKEKLTNQEQLVLAMHYSQDLNFSEIGRLLGVSRSASQSTHGSALKKLRCAVARKDRLLGNETLPKV